MTQIVHDVTDLSFAYVPGKWTLQDISLQIPRGQSVGIVGESGSGKSTLVRVLCGLLRHQKGTATFEGQTIADCLRHDPVTFRTANQMVFQSPASSFDPRMTIGRSLQEPLRAIKGYVAPRQEVAGWLTQVGLPGDLLGRYPHQLSGGQLQRMAVARALSVSPQVLFADEPTSALDVSVQAKVLNLLVDLRQTTGLTIVLVSHDLAVIGRMCSWIVVMKDGRVVEQGSAQDVLTRPRTDYTRRLIAAADAVSLDAQAVA